MEVLNKDVIILLALELDFSSLIAFCLTSKRFNYLICSNNIFWMNKLYQDYPNTRNKFLITADFKKIYVSLKNKVKKYYHYIIDTNDPEIRYFSDYVKKYGELKNIKLQIYSIKYKTIYNDFTVEGDFPSGTKVWFTNGMGFLSKEEALREFENNSCFKYYIDEDFNRRDEFFNETSPKKIYGSQYDDALNFYKQKLQDHDFILHKSFDDYSEVCIMKEIILP